MRCPLSYLVLPLACFAAEPARLDQAPVTVLLYDFAGLDRSARSSAQSKLENLLSPAGIQFTWITCRAGGRDFGVDRCAQPRTGDVYVRLVEGGAVSGGALHLAPAGLSEPEYAARGRITVMLRSLRELRLGTNWQFPDLLACALAHELGHMIGRLDHSAAGLMSPQWSRARLGWMTPAALSFSAAELALFRQAAARRVASSR